MCIRDRLGIELNGRFGYMVDTGGEGQYGMYYQREISYWTPDNTGADYQKPVSYTHLDVYKRQIFCCSKFFSLRTL